MKIISNSRAETIKIGKLIAKNLKVGDILCLFGQLGTGKTVLVKGIAQGLGLNRNKIVSPSFILLQQYKTKIPLYHFDLFRLRNPKEIFALGYEEYLFGNGITVIEWADRIENLLPKEYLKIILEIKGEKKRKINFIPQGKRYQILVKLLKRAYKRFWLASKRIDKRYENLRH